MRAFAVIGVLVLAAVVGLGAKWLLENLTVRDNSEASEPKED